jgi:hypothetical protein
MYSMGDSGGFTARSFRDDAERTLRARPQIYAGRKTAMSELNLKIRCPPLIIVTPPLGSLQVECTTLLDGRGPLRVLDT